jgi:hypothetical protein
MKLKNWLKGWRRGFAPIFLSLLLLISACGAATKEPSRFEQTQAETSQKGAPPAVANNAQQGSSFNRFFPRSSNGYQVVPSQEKQGFAEYKVNKDGKNVAMLSINDTKGTTAADKFQQSTQQIAGYPAVEQGKTVTAVLVKNRYQVKVLSRDASFTKADRASWIEKFNLSGLSRL